MGIIISYIKPLQGSLLNSQYNGKTGPFELIEVVVQLDGSLNPAITS